MFNQDPDPAFFDTTKTCVDGTSLGSWWAKRGKSKDYRPDQPQLVVGVVMRRDGIPIACEIWPGNTADVKTVMPVIEGVEKRSRIRRVGLVCDRGIVSRENLRQIDKAGYQYIVGIKIRGFVEVRDEVLSREGRYGEVDESEALQVKGVWVEDRRYVICLNPEEAKKDRHDREAILEKIRNKPASGSGRRVKVLINNRGYKRFLKIERAKIGIDEDKVRDDARYDGKYVLRTTAELPAAEVAPAYRHLTWIER